MKGVVPVLSMIVLVIVLETGLSNVVTGQSASTQSVKPFPEPEFILRDAPHKEPKSGVQFNGGQITIQQGVGTPSAINALSFSGDGKLLAAGKDFGRVVIWMCSKQ